MAIHPATKAPSFLEVFEYAKFKDELKDESKKRKADNPEPSTMALSDHPQLALRPSKKVCREPGKGEEESGDVENHALPPQLAARSGEGDPADCQDPPLGSAASENVGPSAQSSHASDEVSVGDLAQCHLSQGTSSTHTILQNSTSSSIIPSLGSKTSSTSPKSSTTMADRLDKGEAGQGRTGEELQPEGESGHQAHQETPIRQPVNQQQQVVGGHGVVRTPGTMIQGTGHPTVFNGTRNAVFQGAAGAPGNIPMSTYTTNPMPAYTTTSISAYTTPGPFATSQFHGNVYQPAQFTHAGGPLHGYTFQTPAGMTHGNPIPPTYNQDSFRHRGFPALPAPSPLGNRAQQSMNWRARSGDSSANAPESSSMMMVPYQQPVLAPGHNINQGFNLFQPNTGYVGFPQFQGSTHFMPYQSHSGTIPQVALNGHRLEPSHKALFGNSVNYFFFIPSSLHTYSIPSLFEVNIDRLYNGHIPTHNQKAQLMAQRAPRVGRERDRASHNLPTVYTEEELDDDKWYARWGGGYIELTDDLFARSICPSDLLAHPCPWDEFPGGCQMVRLCSALEKNTIHQCEDRAAGFPRLEVYEGEGRNYRCSHLHWEVEGTCRFVGSKKPCSIVTQKAYNCAVGHDFEIGRQVARSRFEAHVRDALLAGAQRVVRRTSILNNSPRDHTFHLAMATGPGPLPAIHW